jgi:hypothetical protein
MCKGMLADASDQPGLPHTRALGVFLVDHGNKTAQANEMLNLVGGDLCARTSKQSSFEAAHMESAEPTIRQAVEREKEKERTQVAPNVQMKRGSPAT